MTEKELLTFIKNNEESLTLEYKLKPNFHDIKKSIKAIEKRMHFNILRTIYAFANTEGGDLYVGVRDKNKPDRKKIEGIDICDIEIVEKQILSQLDKIIKIDKENIPLKNGRVVIKIQVEKLNSFDKPLLLGGVLYIRENKKTIPVKSFKDHFPLYEDKQLYMCLVEGIKSNLKKLIKGNQFELNQFIEGLKVYIKSVIEKNKIKGYREKLIEAEGLLDKIKQESEQKSKLKGSSTISYQDLDSSIDKFIEIYKNIIHNEV